MLLKDDYELEIRITKVEKYSFFMCSWTCHGVSDYREYPVKSIVRRLKGQYKILLSHKKFPRGVFYPEKVEIDRLLPNF